MARLAPSYKRMPLVTTLPAGPVDGQECLFQNAAMATDGIVWHLRYNAGSAHAYKWEFIGGAEWTVAKHGAGTAIPAAYTSMQATQLTVPLAGEYNVAYGHGGQDLGTGGVTDVYAAVFNNGTNTRLTDDQDCWARITAAYNKFNARAVEKLTIAAGVVLDFRASAPGSANTPGTYFSEITLKPIRVG